MTEYKGSPALDAGLLAAAQAVEHHEISPYGKNIDRECFGFLMVIWPNNRRDRTPVLWRPEARGGSMTSRSRLVRIRVWAISAAFGPPALLIADYLCLPPDALVGCGAGPGSARRIGVGSSPRRLELLPPL
jgi:hypothetical protein